MQDTDSRNSITKGYDPRPHKTKLHGTGTTPHGTATTPHGLATKGHGTTTKSHSTATKLTALLLTALLCVSLSGCGSLLLMPFEQRLQNILCQIPLSYFQGKEVEDQVLTDRDGRRLYDPTQEKAYEKNPAPQGSAKFLEGDVVLVSIYVRTTNHSWTKDEVDYTKEALAMSETWLEEQAEDHGIDLDIHCNEEDLLFAYGDGEYFVKEGKKDYSYKFSDMAGRFLYCLDTQSLSEKYDTDNIGFIFFVPDEGTSFSMPFIKSGDRDDKFYYNEYCNMYLYDESAPEDYENPATYVHEILHLFGATDLYLESEDEHITKEIVSYVENTYPDEIMYYTYEEDNTSNYEDITKMMSPFTLYFLGWDDEEEILDKYPLIKRKNKAAFE